MLAKKYNKIETAANANSGSFQRVDTYPVTSRLGDIFTNLLGRKTKRTDLGGKCGLRTNLTTGGTEVDNLHLSGVELGSCISRRKANVRIFSELRKKAATALKLSLESASEKTSSTTVDDRHECKGETILTHGECERWSVFLWSWRLKKEVGWREERERKIKVKLGEMKILSDIAMRRAWRSGGAGVPKWIS